MLKIEGGQSILSLCSSNIGQQQLDSKEQGQEIGLVTGIESVPISVSKCRSKGTNIDIQLFRADQALSVVGHLTALLGEQPWRCVAYELILGINYFQIWRCQRSNIQFSISYTDAIEYNGRDNCCYGSILLQQFLQLSLFELEYIDGQSICRYQLNNKEQFGKGISGFVHKRKSIIQSERSSNTDYVAFKQLYRGNESEFIRETLILQIIGK
ncbi:MAG: hypothetical protein EZS28_021522 [Streblomastix strix]|uniref:Protein kinase domain-containing protein n=1 Tax=Streblomastix strix TaxID=222440 RepID=A0A5J4VK41_9EUKA|nr:MAG: hypothetical protein EZS28_021522 [Streblomastix strix]